MLPSKYPEIQQYPALKRLLEIQVDMQFADVKTLLQLPTADLEAGCNLSLANILFILIGGASVMFYKAEMAYFAKNKGSGKRFVALLRQHYPWHESDALLGPAAAKVLYQAARNPMTHSFGVGKAAELFPGAPTSLKQAIWLSKSALTAPAAEEALAGEEPRPQWMGPTLASRPGGLEVSVPTLAWGTAAMLRRLFRDPATGRNAERLAAEFQHLPLPHDEEKVDQ